MARGQVHPHAAGKWRVTAYVGTDPVTGTKKRRTEVVPGTRRDAEKRLTAILAEIDGGRDAGSGEHTLGYAIDAFLAHKAGHVEASTLVNYEQQAGYVTTRMRELPLSKIGVEQLELFYAHLLTRGRKRGPGGLSGKAVLNVHLFLHGVLEMSRRRKWVMVNPAADVERPTVKKRKASPARSDRLAELAAACEQVHGRALAVYVRVSIAVGGRRSEVHGLRWAGVDLPGGTLTLSEVVVQGAAGWDVKPRLKNDDETHGVFIGAGTMAALQALRDERELAALEVGVVFDPAGFVFSDDPLGREHWVPSTTLKRFRRACALAGMPETTRLHDLRHLMGTHLTDQRIPVTAVSARMNHSAPSITLDIYSGKVQETTRDAAEVMERLLDGT